jgi:hypothetical protein
MSPFFLIIIAAFFYLIMMALAFLIGGLMMLSKKRRDDGKILILTAFISFPTLLIVGGTLTIISIIPGFGISYLLTQMDLFPLLIFCILGFGLVVAFFALYHWHIGYVMIRNYIKKNSIHKGISDNRIYNIFIKRAVSYLGFK